MFRSPFCARRAGCVTVLALSSALILGGCASTSSSANRALAHPQPSKLEAPLPSLPASADLPALVRYTLAHHPRMRAAAADVRAAKAEAHAAGGLMDPVLNVSQSLAGEEAQSLSVQQSLPLFGKRGLAREQADLRAQAVAALQDQVRLDLTVELIDAYAEYAYITGAGAVLVEQEQLSRQLVQVVGVRYRTGETQQAPLLRMQNQVDDLAREREALIELAEAAGAKLNAALGRPLDASLPAVDLAGVQLADPPAALAERLRAESPLLRATALQLAADQVGRRLAGRAGLPDLMLGAEFMRNPMMSGNSVNLMAGITLPVWRNRYRAQQNQADALYLAREQRLQDQQLQLHAELKMAEYRLREARRRRQLYGDVLQVRASQAFQSTQTAYQSGAATFADLVDSQRELLAFRLGHLRAQADTLVAGAQLMALVDLDLLSAVAGGDHE